MTDTIERTACKNSEIPVNERFVEVNETIEMPNSAEKSILEWESIEEELPDTIDLAMLEEMKRNPDCYEFVSSEEAMKILGI